MSETLKEYKECREMMNEKIFALANIVGGTIVIPYTRRALEFREELKQNS